MSGVPSLLSCLGPASRAQFPSPPAISSARMVRGRAGQGVGARGLWIMGTRLLGAVVGLGRWGDSAALHHLVPVLHLPLRPGPQHGRGSPVPGGCGVSRGTVAGPRREEDTQAGRSSVAFHFPGSQPYSLFCRVPSFLATRRAHLPPACPPLPHPLPGDSVSRTRSCSFLGSCLV